MELCHVPHDLWQYPFHLLPFVITLMPKLRKALKRDLLSAGEELREGGADDIKQCSVDDLPSAESDKRSRTYGKGGRRPVQPVRHESLRRYAILNGVLKLAERVDTRDSGSLAHSFRLLCILLCRLIGAQQTRDETRGQTNTPVEFPAQVRYALGGRDADDPCGRITLAHTHGNNHRDSLRIRTGGSAVSRGLAEHTNGLDAIHDAEISWAHDDGSPIVGPDLDDDEDYLGGRRDVQTMPDLLQQLGG